MLPIIDTSLASIESKWNLGASVTGIVTDRNRQATFFCETRLGTRYLVKTYLDQANFERELLGSLHWRRYSPRHQLYERWPRRAPYVVLYDVFPGQPLSLADGDDAWGRVASSLRIVHIREAEPGLPRLNGGIGWWEWCRRILVNECRLAEEAGRLSAGAAEEHRRAGIAALGDDTDPDMTVVHGRLTADHVLYDADGLDRVCFVGFGGCGIGDAAWDLVSVSQLDHSRLPAMLEHYRAFPAFYDHIASVELPYRIIGYLRMARLLFEAGDDPSAELALLASLA